MALAVWENPRHDPNDASSTHRHGSSTRAVHRTCADDAPRAMTPASMAVLRTFLTSATLLFCELVLIRWTQDRLLYVGFFSNFVLIASFLGMGLGIALGRAGWLPRSPLTALLLFGLLGLVYVVQPGVVAIAHSQQLFGTSFQQLRDVIVVAIVILLITAIMAVIALPLGPLLRSLPPLRAYAADIVGALAGIAAAFVLALLWAPPIVSFGLLVTLLLLGGAVGSGPGRRRPSLLTLTALSGILVLTGIEQSTGETWSPYNRIGIYPSYVGAVGVAGESRQHDGVVDVVVVGGILNESLWKAEFLEGTFYDEVFRQFPERRFRHELVIGAGGGNDAAVGLRNNVARIDAVEIDPVIMARSGARHPDHPYDDPRVRRFVNDGRAHLGQSLERYDLVVLAQSGSRASVAASAGVRLESFLYTREAFASVRDHLTSDGVFAIYYIKAGAAERIAAALEDAFGEPPLARTYHHEFGEAYVLLAGPGTAPLRADLARHGLRILEIPASTVLLSDDWPFLHLASRTISPQYAIALVLMLTFAVLVVAGAARASGQGAAGFSPHFFVLGAAFLLLETRSLIVFSLLFGTSWLVNALVFFAVLCSVLVAIAVTARSRLPRALWYAGLFVALGANYAVRPDTLLFEPAWLRYVVVSVFAFSPIFFANMVFTFSFRETRRADMAFASNLLGAVFGGVAEWLAILTGYQALVLGVGALYGAAYLLGTKVRFGLDRGLERQASPPPIERATG